MSDSLPPACPRCGALLAAGSVEGLCAKCLGALNFATSAVLSEENPVAPAPPLRAEELAPHFPQLEILECLGRGGMGVVYKARQKLLNRLVALKLLAPERAAQSGFAERFAREAQALAALSHPNIVAVHDFGQAGGCYFLLMEFVDGVNLREAMNARRFTPEQALAIVPPICEALQYAHEHGIVHRDIKPENLLLDRGGRVKIADFGVAKMLGDDAAAAAADSQPAGTPQYMAPEQREHQRTDHRADIYSLGVVLYEMLTGERPKDRIEPPSRRVQVDVRIDEIVLRALERAPELRFQTAAEMRTQLETLETAEREAESQAPAPNIVDERGVLTAAWPMFSFWIATTYVGIGLFQTVRAALAGTHLSDGVFVGALIGSACVSAVLAVWLRRSASVDTLRVCFLASAAAAGVEEYEVASSAVLTVLNLTRFGPAAFGREIYARIAFYGIGALLLPLGIWILARAVRRSKSWKARQINGPLTLLVPAVVFARLYIGYVSGMLLMRAHLPARVATHFDIAGRPNGWTSRNADIVFNVIYPLVVVIAFWLFSQSIKWFPRWRLLNIPRRDYWLAPERRAETATLVFRWMLWLASIVAVFSWGLAILIAQANQPRVSRLSPGTMEAWTIAFFVALVIWIVRFISLFAEAGHGPRSEDARGRMTIGDALPRSGISDASKSATADGIFDRMGFLHAGSRWALALSFLGFAGFLGAIPGWERMLGFLWFFVFLPTASLLEKWAGRREPVGEASVRRGRRRQWTGAILIIAIALLSRLLLGQYTVNGDSAAPEIPAGSRILVWKMSHSFTRGDMAAYRQDDHAYVGRVVKSTEKSVTVNRNGRPDEAVPRATVIGKVISVYWRGVSQAELGTSAEDKNAAIMAVKAYTGDVDVWLFQTGIVAPPKTDERKDHPVTLLFQIPENDVQMMVKKLDAGERPPVQAYDRSGEKLLGSGKLIGVENQIDLSTGGLPCKAEVDPEPNALLYPNQSVNVHLMTERKTGVTLVPMTALQFSSASPSSASVHVIDSDGSVSLRRVTVGVPDIRGSREITDGLTPGEIVVANAGEQVKEGERVRYNLVAPESLQPRRRKLTTPN